MDLNDKTKEIEVCLTKLEDIRHIENQMIQSNAILENKRLTEELELLKATLKKNSHAYEVLYNAVKTHVKDNSTLVAIIQDSAKW